MLQAVNVMRGTVMLQALKHMVQRPHKNCQNRPLNRHLRQKLYRCRSDQQSRLRCAQLITLQAGQAM